MHFDPLFKNRNDFDFSARTLAQIEPSSNPFFPFLENNTVWAAKLWTSKHQTFIHKNLQFFIVTYFNLNNFQKTKTKMGPSIPKCSSMFLQKENFKIYIRRLVIIKCKYSHIIFSLKHRRFIVLEKYGQISLNFV